MAKVQILIYIMSARLLIKKEPHPQPLPASGEGRQSIALAGWGSSGLISNQPDMILVISGDRSLWGLVFWRC